MQRRAVLFGMASFATIPRTLAQQNESELRLTLGTATPGGSFPAFGRALIAAVHAVDPGLMIDTTITKGSTENLALLKAGKLDLALVQGEYAYEAMANQNGDGDRLTVAAPIDASPGMFVVPAASPIRNVQDLRGHRVALGTRGSGFTIMGRTVLQGSGIDPESDITPILLDDAADGANQVLDGRAAALWGASLGWPGFKNLAEAAGGARFFGPAPVAIPQILALRASLRRLTVPAGSFHGQDAAVETVGSWSFILARPGLEDVAVARLVRAIDCGRETLARNYPQGRESDPRNLVSNVPAGWLHQATAAYLREVGAVPK
ncbi:TAXI family TRAP transporter solute-binding subunit [Methylobacterium sp. WL30]|nr:TAXI family TRAP transporter solute-binding subunit [Methylobacterium sp. WL116]TXN40824.1 TAXI family TRAP transporter solute-binding subunit [Methylobacterium sp. WL93]TXN50761.1 TAXI family TRAP transporter solute-binding subunit [Methylobacterium sp. WL119]TXN67866.1 TAXI family TRAP transporter solute-binding subunit [Methylobacterium sp. WL30]